MSSAQAKLDLVQQQISDAGYTDLLFDEEGSAQKDLQIARGIQEEIWRGKSRVNWFTHGDRNTSYFHKVAKIRNSSRQINILKSGDLTLENQSDIEHHVLDFFSTLYASENSCTDSGFVRKVIPHLVSVSAEDNSMLTGLPVMDEVKSVVELRGQMDLGVASIGPFGILLVWIFTILCFSSIRLVGSCLI